MNKSSRGNLKIICLLVALLVVSCTPSLRLTVLFDKAEGLKENSEIIMEDERIGKVTGKEVKQDVTRVYVAIHNKYRDEIREESKFYYVTRDGGPRIEVIVTDKSSPKMENDEVLEGYPEYRYWIDMGLRKAKEGITDFFKSEKWKNFKENLREEVEKSSKEGEGWLEENLPEIKKKTKEMFRKFEEEYGKEAREKAKAFVDSLLKEARENDGS